MRKHRKVLLVAAVAALASTSLAGPAQAGKTGSGGSGNTPIVFVNGYRDWDNAGTSTIKGNFQKAGYTNLYTFSYDSTQHISDSAKQLNDYIANIKSTTGFSSVNGVGHSEGGLVLSKSQVSKFVAMGSPFKGTTTANACFDPACYDMRPPGPGGSATQCVWSDCDEIVLPNSSAVCSGKSCGCVSHNSIGDTQVAWDVSKATVG